MKKTSNFSSKKNINKRIAFILNINVVIKLIKNE